MKEPLVRRENVGNVATVLIERFGAQLPRGLAMIFRVTNPAENVPGRQAVVIDLQLGHCQFNGRELIVIIVNGKIPRQASCRCFAPQKARAQGMKCGKPGLRGWDTSAQQQARNTIAHFFRGLVGERHREYGFRRNPIRDQVRHAIRDGPRLAGTSTGQDEDRPICGFDRKPLFRVQFVK